MGIENLIPQQPNEQVEVNQGLDSLITQPKQAVTPTIDVPVNQSAIQATQVPSTQDFTDARKKAEQEYQASVANNRQQLITAKAKQDEAIVAQSKANTDNVKPIVNEWVMGEVAKKQSFFPNYGALSREGQFEYIDGVAKNMSQSYGIPYEQARQALLDKFAISSFDKTHTADPSDKSWAQYPINLLNNIGGVLHETAAGLGQFMWGGLTMGVGLGADAVAGAVDIGNTLINIEQGTNRKFDKDKFRAELDQSSLIQGIIHNSNNAERWRAWAQTQYSADMQEARTRGGEVRQRDGVGAGLLYDLKNFDTTATTIIPDILGGMATIITTGGLGNVVGAARAVAPKVLGRAAAPTTTRATLDVPVKSLTRSIREIGVPLAAYGTGTQVAQLRPTYGTPTTDQQLALGTMFLSSAILNGVSGRFGGSLEATFAGIQGRNASYLSNRVLAQIAQGAVVDGAVGAADGMQQAALIVAQGSKEKPVFSLENIQRNMDAVTYAGVLGGVLGGVGGGIGAFYAGRGQAAAAARRAGETPTPDAVPSPADTTQVQQAEAVPSQAEVEVQQFDFTQPTAPELQPMMHEINNALNTNDLSPENIAYIKSLAQDAQALIRDLDAIHSIENGGLSPYQRHLDALQQVDADPTTMMAQRQAPTQAQAQVVAAELPSVPVRQVEVGSYATDGDIEGTVISQGQKSALIFDEANNRAIITDRDGLTTERTALPPRPELQVDDTTSFLVGDTVRDGNQTYSVYEAAPLYKKDSDGNSSRVGDLYTLRDEQGNSTQRIVRSSNTSLNRVGDFMGDNLSQPQGYSQPTIRVQKRNRSDAKGQGNNAESLEQQAQARTSDARRTQRNATASDGRQRAEQRKQHRAEVIAAASPAVGRIDYLTAVVPQMFEAGSAQNLVSRALKSGIEQQILDTLHMLAQMTPPRNGRETAHTRDQRTALNLLKGNGDGVQLIKEHNENYIIPLASDMQQLATSSLVGRPKIAARPTSVLLEGHNRRKESNRTEEEIIQDDAVDALLSQTLSREELGTFDSTEINAIVSRMLDEEVPVDIGRILIEADLTRTKTELPSEVAERIYAEYAADPSLTPDRLTALENSVTALERATAKLDQRARELDSESVQLLADHMRNDVDELVQTIKEVTPIFTDPTINTGALIGSRQLSSDASKVSSGEVQLGTHNTSADVMLAVLNAEGVIANQVRSLNLWKSAQARGLLRKAGVDPAKIMSALRKIVDASLEPILATSALGKDIQRASQLLELINLVATTGVSARSTVVVSNPVPNSVTVTLPIARVSPLQAALNEAFVENGMFLNDTPITAVDRMARMSDEVAFVTETFDNITAQVMSDLNVETAVELTPTQQEFVNVIGEHNREVVRLDSLHSQRYALIEDITHLEIERAKHGSKGKVVEQVISNQEQLATLDTAIAAANVQIKTHLNRIAELREADPMLYASFPHNDFYQVDHTTLASAPPTPETLALLGNTDVDYNQGFIEQAIAIHEVDTTVENMVAIKRSQAIDQHVVDIDRIEQIVDGDMQDLPDRQAFPRSQAVLAQTVEEAINAKMATDAVHTLDTGNLQGRTTTDVLSDYAVIDEGLGLHTLDGITQYLESDNGSFVPASALAEENFTGAYPYLNDIATDENGFVHISEVRKLMGRVLKDNADYPTSDGLKAQAYLQATTTARALKGKALGMSEAFISNANPYFVQGNEVMSKADAHLGTLIENGQIQEALVYINSLAKDNPNLASTTKFLLEVAHRFMPSIRTDIRNNGNFGGSYDYNTGMITFTGGAHKNPYVVLHEYTHGLVDALFNIDPSHLTDVQYQARKALEELYHFSFDQNALTRYSKEGGLKEWIAETLSDVEQSDLMHQMRTDTPEAYAFLDRISNGQNFLRNLRSFYDYFVTKIRDLFGFDSVGRAQQAQDTAVKNGTNILDTDPIHTGLTDILSALHLYSKPTSKKAYNKFVPRKDAYGNEAKPTENGKQNTAPQAATPQGDFVSGIPDGAQILMITDFFNGVRNYTGYAGMIKRIGDTNRFELIMRNGHQMQQTVGTLPQLVAQLDSEGVGRYSITEHVVAKEGIINEDILSLQYNKGLGTYYLVGQFPKPFRRWIADQVAKSVEDHYNKYINKDGTLKQGVTQPNLGNLPFKLKLIDMIARFATFTTQFARPSNVLDAFHRMHQTLLDGVDDPTLRATLEGNLQAADLSAFYRGNGIGKRDAYSQNRNSKLHEIRDTIEKMIPDATDRQAFGLYLVAKHSIERDNAYKGAVRVGRNVADAWSGMTYAGKRGVEASNQILSDMFADRKALEPIFEKASQLLHDEHARLLKEQYDSGYIDRDTYYAYQQYEHYVPLVNRDGDGGDIYISDVRQLMGRQTNARDGYISLLEYLSTANAELQMNNAKQAIATQLEALVPLGIVNMSRVEARLQFNPDTGSYAYRNTRESEFAKNTMYYYRNGKQHIITANTAHPRGQALSWFFNSLLPPDTSRHPILEGTRRVFTQAAILEAMGAVGTSLSFVLQTLGWNTTVPLANGQAAFRTNARDGWSISLRTYRYMAKNLLNLHKISTAHAGGQYARAVASPDAMYMMYQRQGGGLGGGHLLLGDGEGSALQNTTFANVLDGGQSLQKRFPHPLPETNQTRGSLALNALDTNYRNAMGKVGDISNIPDAITRFSSWQAGIETLGTPQMKKALRDGDVVRLEALLNENPILQAQLNNGSKEIIGNFQERSMLGRWGGMYAFLNAGLQGLELFRNLAMSKQGQQAAGVFFLVGVLNSMLNSQNEDNKGLDGRNALALNPQAQKGFMARWDGDLINYPLDYALRPFYAAGTMAGAFGMGEVTAAEALGMWGKTFADTVIPLTRGQTDSGMTNDLTALLPTVIKSTVMPIAWNTSQFSTNVDGRASIMNDEGEIIDAINPPSTAFYGKSGFFTAIGQNVPLSPSAPRLEASIGGIIGEPFRVGVELGRVSESNEDKLRYAVRSITPTDSDIYRYSKEFGDFFDEINKAYYDANNNPDAKGSAEIKEMYEYVKDVENQRKRMTSDDGSNSATIRYYLDRAQSDEEKLYWTQQKKSLQLNVAQLTAEANVNIRAYKAESQGNASEANVLLQNYQEAQERYNNNPQRVMDLLKTVRGR